MDRAEEIAARTVNAVRFRHREWNEAAWLFEGEHLVRAPRGAALAPKLSARLHNKSPALRHGPRSRRWLEDVETGARAGGREEADVRKNGEAAVGEEGEVAGGGRNILLVSTVPGAHEKVRGSISRASSVKVVVPVVRQGFLDWLANDEQAFAEAKEIAEETAGELPAETVEAVAGEAEVGLAIRDALATFPADEIVVVLAEEDESRASEAMRPDRSFDGVPLRSIYVGSDRADGDAERALPQADARASGRAHRRPHVDVALLVWTAVSIVVIAAIATVSGYLVHLYHEAAQGSERAWPTNGGTTFNQRYAPLDQITAENVDGLKGVWRTDLGSAKEAKYSAEGQPIVEDGVIYIPTGNDDVFAVDAASGKIKWKYAAGISQKISTVCCGWLSRGVALGEGKVFIGQLDGNLVALDQRTGKVDWKTAVGDWRKGYTITAAPLYYDGKVVTGVSGGEFGIRGRVQAYDARTGKLVWQFHTIPGPGDKGHDTWPANDDAWMHGGAPVWQTPALDPELGLIYFSTGNASPDLDGSGRAGDNLFAASIVALDANTGAYRWHFQQVHHDIWDYDSPSPVVLFDATYGGKERKALAQTSKTGWTYVVDRETGKPLLPTPETKVPQDPTQKTSGTQPIPSYDPFIPHEITDADVAKIRKLTKEDGNGKTPEVLAGRIFEPFGKEIRVIAPGPQGGVNWQPTSYNPKTGLIYICAQRAVSGYTRSGIEAPKEPGKSALGSVFTTTGFGSQTGYFGAWDPTTGKIAWQKRWPESCYSGTVTTGGGLVFVGRNNGELQAYGAADGKLHWSFQTGAGANSTVTVFERDGKEQIAFLAGGNALAATAHGANLWLFSLDGNLGPVEAGSGGAGVEHTGDSSQDGGAGKPDPVAGMQVFESNCSGCHGLSGKGGNGGPSLVSKRARQKVVSQVTNGGGGMPAFGDTLSKAQIADVSAYVTETIEGGSK